MAGILPKFKPAAIGAGGARPAIRPVRPAPPPAPPKPPRPKRPSSGIGERGEGSYDVGVETAQYREPETMDAPPGMQAANVIDAARARQAAGVMPRSIDELADEAAYGQSYEEPASYGQESYGLHGRAGQGAYADPSYRDSFAPETCAPEERSYYPRHAVEERRPPSIAPRERDGDGEDETRARDEDEIAQFRQAYHAGNLATPYDALPSVEARVPSRPAREERYEDRYGVDEQREEPTAYGARDEELETRDVLGRDVRRHESGARARPREEAKSHDESYFPAPHPEPASYDQPDPEPALPLPPPPVRAESQFPLGVQPLREVPPAPPSPMPAAHAVPATEVAREGVGTNPQLVQQQLMQQQLMQQQLMQQQLMQQQLMQQQLLAQQHAQAQVPPAPPAPPAMQAPHGLVPPPQLAFHPHGHAAPPHVPHLHVSMGPMGQSMGPSMAPPPHGTAVYGGHPAAHPVASVRPTQAGSPRPAGTAAQTVLTRAQSNEGLLAQTFLRAAKGLGRLPWFVAGVTFGIAFMFFATTLLLERGNAPQPVASAPTAMAPTAHPPVATAPITATAPPSVVAPVVQAPVAMAPVVTPTVTPAALPAAPATVATYQPTYAPAPPPTGYSGDPYAAYRAPPPPAPRHYAPPRPAAPRAPAAPAPAAAPEPPAADLSDLMNKALAP